MKKGKRFTVEEKIETIQLYLCGNYSYREVGELVGVDKKSVRKWVRLFQTHGVEGLLPRSSCTYYEPSFKLDVLNDRLETGASYFTTAIHFNLSSPSTVQRWEEQYQRAGGDAFVSRKEGPSIMPKKEPLEQDKMKALQAELEQLRMENAYLKKLNALVQAKEKSPNKTK